MSAAFVFFLHLKQNTNGEKNIMHNAIHKECVECAQVVMARCNVHH